jgi:hypothetical protein
MTVQGQRNTSAAMGCSSSWQGHSSCSKTCWVQCR